MRRLGYSYPPVGCASFVLPAAAPAARGAKQRRTRWAVFGLKVGDPGASLTGYTETPGQAGSGPVGANPWGLSDRPPKCP